MKYFFILLLTFSLYQASGQVGFNKTYDFDYPFALFNNIILKEDTLILYGRALDPVDLVQGVIFVKMDTLGNVLNQRFHKDSLGDDYILEPNYDIIHTSDGGYAAVGNLFSRIWGFLIKLDENFNIEFVREYPDLDVLNVVHRKILEVNDGYLITGHKNRDYQQDLFVMKTDLEGNMKWQQFYGESESNEIGRDIVKLDDNNIFIGITEGKNDSQNLDERWGRSKIICVDSLGNLKSEWTSPLFEESTVSGLHPMNDGGWIYMSRQASPVPGVDSWIADCKVVRRDSNFNLVWDKQITHTAFSPNTALDLISLPNNNWLAVGNWKKEYPDSTIYSGGMYVVSESGDSIWSRMDTIFSSPNWASAGVHSGAVALSSGSVITAGYGINVEEYSKYYGWLVKVDNSGCMDTLCVSTSTITPTQEESKFIQIYPNPANEEITIQVDSFNDYGSIISLYSVTGVRYKSIPAFFKDNKTNIKITDIPNGIYILTIENNEGIFHQQKVVIQH